MSSPQTDLTAQFLSDLALDGCVIQAGTTNRVDIFLTPENYRAYLEAHQNENLYCLACVPEAVGMRRAGDKDIQRKHYCYLDFDIRKFYQQEQKEELSDTEVQEVAVGILHSLSTHALLSQHRCAFFTGNGMHVYYIGSPVEVHSAEHWGRGMKMLCAMAAKLVGSIPLDTASTNVARIGRIVGSFNNKNGRQIPTEMLAYNERATFDISMIEEMGKQENAVPQEVPTNGDQLSEVREGSRNATLTSIAGTLRRRGLDDSALVGALQAINISSCKPPLDEREVRKIAKSVSKYSVMPSGTPMLQAPSMPVLVRLSDVVPESVQWIWQDRIAEGKLTLFSGNPGEGKSWCSLAVACAITLGKPLPGDEALAAHRNPAKVLLLAAEDGPADTIRPRLEGMGADLDRVTVMTGVKDDGKDDERHFTLARDLGSVEKVLKEGGYALVIIDPINAYLGDVDTHKDAAVRTVLTPLTKLAERYGVALVCIRHLTKSQRDLPIFRGQGSIGYTGAARVEHLIGTHPENKQQRFMICIKNNLAELPPPISFEVVNGQFLWGGVCNMSADELLAPSGRGDGHPALDDAVEFLEGVLAGGGRSVADIREEAEANGISKRTLNRAKQELGIKAQKQKGFGAEGGWMWQLPKEKEASDTKEDLWHSLEEKA